MTSDTTVIPFRQPDAIDDPLTKSRSNRQQLKSCRHQSEYRTQGSVLVPRHT